LEHNILNEIYQTWEFSVDVCVTQREHTATRFLQEFVIDRGIRLIGFDLESKPGFKKGEKPRITLFQFAVEVNSQIFVLLYHTPRPHSMIPFSIVDILEDARFLKCGVGVNGLGSDCHGLYTQFGINTRGSIELLEFTKEGLKAAVAKISRGVKAPKYSDVCSSNWGRPQLNQKQIMYATLDAVYGLCLAQHCQKMGHQLENPEDTATAINRLVHEKQQRQTEKRRLARERKRIKRLASLMGEVSFYIESNYSCDSDDSDPIATIIITYYDHFGAKEMSVLESMQLQTPKNEKNSTNPMVTVATQEKIEKNCTEKMATTGPQEKSATEKRRLARQRKKIKRLRDLCARMSKYIQREHVCRRKVSDTMARIIVQYVQKWDPSEF